MKFQKFVLSHCELVVKGLSFNQMSVMSINLSYIAILNMKDSDYHCIISIISKNETINLMQNTYLTEKSVKL